MVIHTSLTDSEIDSIITMSDAEIDKEIGAQETSDPVYRKLSTLISALTIKGRQPKSSAAGEYKEDSGNIMEVWGIEVARIKKLYKPMVISGSGYQVIDEDKRYSEETV